MYNFVLQYVVKNTLRLIRFILKYMDRILLMIIGPKVGFVFCASTQCTV